MSQFTLRSTVMCSGITWTKRTYLFSHCISVKKFIFYRAYEKSDCLHCLYV
jgi:hypothetical protein